MEREIRYEDPEKVAAWLAVTHEIEAGRMKPAKDQECSDCRAPAKYLHHHKGYTPPNDLEVIPLCSTCHGKKHGRKVKP
jgi:hypothetical protein